MAEPRSDDCLAVETCQRFAVSRLRTAQHLNRHALSQAEVLGFIHRLHSTLADPPDEFVHVP
jgi:hypothetical protein